MARITNEQKIESFINENIESLKKYLAMNNQKDVAEWVFGKVQDYKENWKEFGIETRCTIENILDNILMDMG